MIVIDPQIAAVAPDTSEAGHIRAKIISGELVRVPFKAGAVYAANAGATATLNTGNMVWNDDKSMSAYNLSVPISSAGDTVSVEIWREFWGTKLGLYWRRSLATVRNIDVLVDGVVYPVETYPTLLAAEGSPGNVTATGMALVADDLPDGRHTAVVVITASVSVVRALLLFGFLLERRAGYNDPTPVMNFATFVAVPNGAQTAISLGNSPDQLRWMRKVLYYNPTGGTITITLQNAGQTFKKIDLLADGGGEYDFGGATAQTGTITHIASASGAFYAPIGGV